MIARITLIAIFATLACRPVAAQVDTKVVDALRVAIEAGDASAVLVLADERMEVGLFGAVQLYSRSQARHVLDRFFEEYPPARLTIADATETETGWYAAAAYHTAAGGIPLRMYLRLRFDGDEWQVRELVVQRPDR